MDSQHTGCTVCTAPTADAIFLCRAHESLLVERLREVPGLVGDLEVTVTRQNRTVAERHGSRSTTAPLPWNEHAAQAAATLAAALNDASLLVGGIEQDERDPLGGVAVYDSANLARWLARNMVTLRRAPEAGELFATLDDAITVARRATDRPIEHVFAGPCRTALSDGRCCRGDVYGRPGASEARCDDCGARFDAAERRAWMLSEIEDQATHSGLLASLVTGLGQPVGSSTIRKWAAAGRLRVVSVDRKGRKQYRIGEVLELLHPERVTARAGSPS